VNAVSTSPRLAPSILSADFTRLGEQVKAAEEAGASQIHIDVMDGQFVEPITMGQIVVSAVKRATALPLDVHLMTVDPDHLLPTFREAGADWITIHVEASPDPEKSIAAIHALGAKAGISIKPDTPLDAVINLLPLVDLLLIMTVEPGFGGQPLIPHTLEKVRAAEALRKSHKYSFAISVDGGINLKTIAAAVEAGASILVVGSAVFNAAASVAENMTRLKTALGGEKT